MKGRTRLSSLYAGDIPFEYNPVVTKAFCSAKMNLLFLTELLLALFSGETDGPVGIHPQSHAQTQVDIFCHLNDVTESLGEDEVSTGKTGQQESGR